jgi:D-arginine dehydrogenase
MSITADFLVVGAGIAGASAAYELAAHGSVVLVEQEATPGHHTTGRSAALYTESYEKAPVRILVQASRDHLESPPEGFSQSPILKPLPVLYVGRDDQRSTLDQIATAAVGAAPLEHLDTNEAVRACPVLRSDYVASGLLEAGSMEIDVHALLQGFLRGTRRRGGRLITSAPVTAMTRSGSAWRVSAGRDTLEAGVVVNAAGSWCDTVAVAAGAKPLGLTPYRRTALTFGPPRGTDITGWPMVVDADEEFYFKPEVTQLMGSLAEETPMHPHDVRPEEIDVALAVERINAATTFDIRHVRRTWAGLRTFSPDRLPVVGFDPEVEDFFWLGGQGGYGIMTSPAMARLASGLLTEGRVPADLTRAGFAGSDTDPGRFRR